MAENKTKTRTARKSPPQKNEVKVKYDGRFNLYYIVTTATTPLPEELKGRFTSEKLATQAINIYYK